MGRMKRSHHLPKQGGGNKVTAITTVAAPYPHASCTLTLASILYLPWAMSSTHQIALDRRTAGALPLVAADPARRNTTHSTCVCSMEGQQQTLGPLRAFLQVRIQLSQRHAHDCTLAGADHSPHSRLYGCLGRQEMMATHHNQLHREQIEYDAQGMHQHPLDVPTHKTYASQTGTSVRLHRQKLGHKPFAWQLAQPMRSMPP